MPRRSVIELRATTVREVDSRRMRAQIIAGPAVKGRAARAQNRVWLRAKATAPRRTGRLKASHVKLPLRPTPAGWIGDVIATARYARWVHDGRGPVHPKRAKVLAFRGRGGQMVFARRVGPARPQPWLRLALEWVAAREGMRTERR